MSKALTDVPFRSFSPTADTTAASFEALAPDTAQFDFDGPDERESFIGCVRSGVRALARAPHRPGVLYAPEDATAAFLQSFLEEHTDAVPEALLASGKAAPVAGGYEVKFDEHDLLGWGASLLTWFRRYVDKHPFVRAPAQPEAASNHLRVAVMGDWGTGRYGAPVCASSIESAKDPFDVVPNEYVGDEPERFGPNGYATLEFVDGHLDERGHSADGRVLYQKDLA